jgi:hypothetical protein
MLATRTPETSPLTFAALRHELGIPDGSICRVTPCGVTRMSTLPKSPAALKAATAPRRPSAMVTTAQQRQKYRDEHRLACGRIADIAAELKYPVERKENE